MFDNKPIYEIAMIAASSLIIPIAAFFLTDSVKPRYWKPDPKCWLSAIALTPLVTFIVAYATLTEGTKTTSEATIYRNHMNAKVLIRYYQGRDDEDKPRYYDISSDKPLDRPKEEAELELTHELGYDDGATITVTKDNTSASRDVDNVYLHGVDSATEIKRITITTEERTIYFRSKPIVTGVEQSAHVTLKDNSKEKDKLDKLFEPSKTRKD